MEARRLRVGIDARLVSGSWGGVEQAIIGLASGLGTLEDGDEEFLFLVEAGQTEWLEPFLGANSKLLVVGPQPRSLRLRVADRAMRRLAVEHGPLAAALQRAKYLPVPSDGTIERARLDIMHFTMQVGFRTTVPSLYQPHDLQHLHLPELFTAEDIARREISYRALCTQAVSVVAMTTWGRADLIRQYHLPPEKVIVIPWGSVLATYRDSPASSGATEAEGDLPGHFALYPAQPWPHKNHARLLEACRILQDQGITVPLVLTGGGGERRSQLQAYALDLKVQVHDLGFVSPTKIGRLYRSARILVFPSLFEGWGMPVLEAFDAGLPVACSSITNLPDLTAGAAVLFDPLDPGSIASAIRRLWTDPELRAQLASTGRQRATSFSWRTTARTYRAHYRRIAGLRTTAEDRELLAAAPIV